MPDTAPHLMWRAFGACPPEGKTGSQYRFEAAVGHCTICGAAIGEGVPFTPRRGVAGIDNATFSGYAEYARWGTHVCAACAWLCGDPKRTHRGMLVIGERGWWPTIAQVVEGRPRWRRVFGEIARAAAGTPLTGVLTTDPKPRLWPRALLATCGSPGLYLHIPEQDISCWSGFALRGVAAALAAVDYAVALGATKSAALRCLLAAPNLVDKWGLDVVHQAERALAPYRGTVELSIAAVIA